MERQEIIKQLKNYFDIRELVCPHTYQKLGELSWMVIPTAQLFNIWLLRTKILKVPMTINNYHIGGQYSQRGNRCNVCQLVKDQTLKNNPYLSAHIMASADDADIKGMTAEQARDKIRKNQNLLQYPMRIEQSVTWLHFDSYDMGNGKMLNEFQG